MILPVLPRYPQSWLVAFSMHWHEKHVVWLWDAFLNQHPSPVFVDVGANFGLHTFRLAAAGATCFAIEPQSECVSYIRLVSALNGWRIATKRTAVADKQGMVVLHRAKGTFTSSLLEGWVERWDEPASPEEVPCTTLDAFCREYECVPDLIKCDVEGAEAQVIAGASECVASRRATWVIESLPGSGSREYLWESFARLGYVVWRLGPLGLRRVGSLEEFRGAPEWEFVFSPDAGLFDLAQYGKP